MKRDFVATKTNKRRNISYSHTRSGSDGRNRKMEMTLLFQVGADVAAITKKKEVVDVTANVVAEEVVTLPYKPMKMSTLGRTRV